MIKNIYYLKYDLSLNCVNRVIVYDLNFSFYGIAVICRDEHGNLIHG